MEWIKLKDKLPELDKIYLVLLGSEGQYSLKDVERPWDLIQEGVLFNLKYSAREDMVLIKPYKEKH